jgi:hypothetical protein
MFLYMIFDPEVGEVVFTVSDHCNHHLSIRPGLWNPSRDRNDGFDGSIIKNDTGVIIDFHFFRIGP